MCFIAIIVGFIIVSVKQPYLIHIMIKPVLKFSKINYFPSHPLGNLVDSHQIASAGENLPHSQEGIFILERTGVVGE